MKRAIAENLLRTGEPPMIVRIQYRCTKGWRKSPNTVYCGRPGPLGNPYPTTAEYRKHVLPGLTEVQLEPLLRAGHAGC